MKNFIKKSVLFTFLFAIFFVLVNVIYILVIAHTDFDFRKRLESLRFKNPNFELLALGASTTLDGIDTEYLTLAKMNSYNLALGGSTVKTNFIQLNEYLAKYSKRPQYVLLGLNSIMVKSYDDELIQPIVEVTMEDHKYSINDIPILKFKWLGFEVVKKIVSKNHRQAIMSLGQVKFQKTIPDKTNYKESYLNVKEFESSFWIGEIAKLCAQNGIEFMIIEMPGYRATQNFSNVGPYELSFTNGFSAKLYNLESKDFCTIFNSDTDWIGNSHLNEFGALKLTKELIKIIKQ